MTLATSYAALPALNKINEELNKIKNLKSTVKPVKAEYWGENITVAGLITSEDLIRTLKNDESDYVVVPSVMLKPFTELFLDGKSLDYVKEQTKKDFIVIKEQYSIKQLIEFIKTYE